MGYFNQVDPFSFAPQISVLFPASGLDRITGNPATGDLTAVLPAPLYARIAGSGGKGLVVDRRELSKGNAGSYKILFQSASDRLQIPFVLGPLSLIPVVGTVITIVTSTVDGLSRISTTSVSADQLSILMADGGAFSKVYAISRVGSESRLGITIVYAVSVGREARLYQIMTSVYAVSPGP